MKRFLSRLLTYRTVEEVPFSFGFFLGFAAIQTTIFVAVVYGFCWLFNKDLIAAQLGHGWLTYFGWFSLMSLMMSLVEYLFHRYTLHHPMFRFLTTFMHKHGRHHGLTHVVGLKKTINEAGLVEVRFKYSIEEPEQIKSSTFPAYTLVTFWLVFSVLFVPLQLLLSTQPILVTGYGAVLVSFVLYEVIHAIEHLDYKKHWQKWVEAKDEQGQWRYGWIREFYGFHLMHHRYPQVNMAIGGFWGFAVWDRIFHTRYVPDNLPLPGALVQLTETLPVPRWPISWLDKVVARKEAETKLLDRIKALKKKEEEDQQAEGEEPKQKTRVH